MTAAERRARTDEEKAQPIVAEHWLGATPSNRAGFFSIVSALCPLTAIEPVEAAYRMAKEAHRKKSRDSGERYFNHPRRAAVTLMADLRIADWEWIVTELLHDVREDSYMLQAWAIQRLFGENVLRSVTLLTKAPKEGYLDRLVALGKPMDWMVKLADRLDNVRTLGGCTPEKRANQLTETRRYYLPLAERLCDKLPPDERWRGIFLKEQIEMACVRWEQEALPNERDYSKQSIRASL